MLEKQIEAKVVKTAKILGFICLKLNGQGQRSWPDRMFMHPSGAIVFIELKRPGGVLSAGQSENHRLLLHCKQNANICYSYEVAVEVLKRAIEAQGSYTIYDATRKSAILNNSVKI